MSQPTFAALLRSWRERNRFSREAAALLLAVSLRNIENWEVGRRTPRGFALAALMEIITPPKKTKKVA